MASGKAPPDMVEGKEEADSGCCVGFGLSFRLVGAKRQNPAMVLTQIHNTLFERSACSRMIGLSFAPQWAGGGGVDQREKTQHGVLFLRIPLFVFNV